jgi:hypothetical protein
MRRAQREADFDDGAAAKAKVSAERSEQGQVWALRADQMRKPTPSRCPWKHRRPDPAKTLHKKAVGLIR